MNQRTLLAGLIALLPLAATAADATPEEPTSRQPYACTNGSRIDISFLADISGRPQAILHFADGNMTLPAVPAASGALYRNGDIKLHTQGTDALFEDGKGNVIRCRQGDLPPASPPAASTAAAGSFIELAGSVGYRARIALPPDAILTIRIRSAGRTLVEQRYELNGAQPPIPFAATVDRDLLGKKGSLTVNARIEQRGKLRYAGSKTFPSAGLPLDLELRPVAKR